MSLVLDLTASFTDVSAPTPFGIYDSDSTFSSDADGMVKLVNSKLGGSILQVELANRDVYGCFEEALLEYSGMVNSYHAKSIMADLLGSETGSLSGKEQKFARMSLGLAKRRAEAYSSETLVGGTRTLHSSSISTVIGQQNYDLDTLLSSSSTVTGSQRAEIREVFHFSPTAAFRFFDTTSAINYLHNQFSFESFTPETIFYLLPIWEDVLRATQLEQSHKIRRSNYSYNVINNQLKIYPVPTTATNIYFTYYLANDDPFDSSNDPLVDGISNLSNVPFGNIGYNKINSIGRQWVRRFALAASKEVLGQVRSKVQAVPIPNGDLLLNGSDLVLQAKDEMTNLREELKTLLDSLTYDKLAEQEAAQAENLQRQLAKVPMGIFMGSFLLYFQILNDMFGEL